MYVIFVQPLIGNYITAESSKYENVLRSNNATVCLGHGQKVVHSITWWHPTSTTHHWKSQHCAVTHS